MDYSGLINGALQDVQNLSESYGNFGGNSFGGLSRGGIGNILAKFAGGAFIGLIVLIILSFFAYLFAKAMSGKLSFGWWAVYKKMGRDGWECLVPVYSFYALCKVLYGSGWNFLKVIIPIYNIFFIIKFYKDIAKSFGQSEKFWWWIVFPFMYQCKLGLTHSLYKEGKYALEDDFVSDLFRISYSSSTYKKNEIKVPVPTQDNQQPSNVCPKCGNPIRLGAKFCTRCGEQL